MYVVTNRRLDDNERGLAVFGSVPNEKGPNELRLVKLRRAGSGFRSEVLEDEVPRQRVRALKRQMNLDIDTEKTWYASFSVACELLKEARRKRRHLLVYVHGYNNDLKDIIDTAHKLERLYKVIAVPFSWPANGGGALSGTLSYLSDKRDARASVDALNRFIDKIGEYHLLLTEARQAQLKVQASRLHPDNPQAAQEAFAELLDSDCKVSLNLMCHSMGNYVFKHALLPSGTGSRKLVFDNVSLVAADTNNQEHRNWVENIQVRNRLAVFINEDDFALAWSRRKPGGEQLARLGHLLQGLVAPNAYYIDVTEAPGVKNSHGYFQDQAVHRKAGLREVFAAAFEGRKPEADLRYHSDRNAYTLV